MRKYEDIESELFELYDLVDVTKNKIDDLEGELNYLNEKSMLSKKNWRH